MPHNYDTRVDKPNKGVQTLDQEKRNHEVPVMLVLLLDCISQLLIQFPTHFEFNESLLVLIMDEYYFARYLLSNTVTTIPTLISLQ